MVSTMRFSYRAFHGFCYIARLVYIPSYVLEMPCRKTSEKSFNLGSCANKIVAQSSCLAY